MAKSLRSVLIYCHLCSGSCSKKLDAGGGCPPQPFLNHSTGLGEGGEEAMILDACTITPDRIMELVNRANVQLMPQQMKMLGLQPDSIKQITPEFVATVIFADNG